MKSSLVLTVLAGSLLLSGQANSLTLTNNESLPQNVVTITGDQEEALSIGPGETIEGLCNIPCVLRLPDGSEYELEAEDRVALEDGTIFVDPNEQGSSAADQEEKGKKL